MQQKDRTSRRAIVIPEGTIRPEVKLIGADGNAFTVLGLTARALREAGNTDEVVSSYIDQASSGDYDQLLLVTMEFAEVN